jgi:hypothetical protein
VVLIALDSLKELNREYLQTPVIDAKIHERGIYVLSETTLLVVNRDGQVSVRNGFDTASHLKAGPDGVFILQDNGNSMQI